MRYILAATEDRAATEVIRAAFRRPFQVDVAATVDRMTSDPKRIAQIVSNLLSNAVKFTEHGRIVLQAKADRERGSSSRSRRWEAVGRSITTARASASPSRCISPGRSEATSPCRARPAQEAGSR